MLLLRRGWGAARRKIRWWTLPRLPNAQRSLRELFPRQVLRDCCCCCCCCCRRVSPSKCLLRAWFLRNCCCSRCCRRAAASKRLLWAWLLVPEPLPTPAALKLAAAPQTEMTPQTAMAAKVSLSSAAWDPLLPRRCWDDMARSCPATPRRQLASLLLSASLLENEHPGHHVDRHAP